MIMVIGGLLMAAAGILVTFFPPKSINSLYGYRTKRSMADESQWKEGNRFSALLMILFGLISAAAGFAGSSLIRLTSAVRPDRSGRNIDCDQRTDHRLNRKKIETNGEENR